MSHLGQRLSALVDNELGPAERDRVLAHLAWCEPCRMEAIALRALKQRMHTLSEAAAGTDLISRLLAMTPPPGFPAAARSRRAGRRRAAVAVAASSQTVAGLAMAAFLAGGGPPRPAPTITPAVDVFMVQHAITPGTVPRPLSPGPSAHPRAPGSP